MKRLRGMGGNQWAGWACWLMLLVGSGCATKPAVVCLEPGHVTRIACVGDSITYGAGTPLRTFNAYPAQLQRMFGDRAVVGNFGRSGATLMNAGNRPYQKLQLYQDALAFEPDVVVVLLGTNDTKPDNWQHKASFEADYKALVASFAALPSHPTIYIGYPLVVVGEGNYKINEAGVQEQRPMIARVAQEMGVAVIDQHETLLDAPELIPDRVHPNAEGYTLMAKKVYETLTGKPFAGEVPAVLKSEWNGFEQQEFECAGRAAKVVFPQHAAAGHPWIWRTEFFNAFPMADRALLAEGWAVAYVSMPDLYGAPKAMEVMDTFYAQVMKDYALAPKVVLEGFSRGGLYAFNWAARAPENVAAIYADAPVLDFKSWPGGKGSGPGSAKDWKKCLRAYGMTEEEAMAYAFNPVDNLAPIAQANIPILIVAGDADTVVPVTENTLMAKERYEALGGTIQVILKPGVDHHPHSLEEPAPIVQFLQQHAGQ